MLQNPRREQRDGGEVSGLAALRKKPRPFLPFERSRSRRAWEQEGAKEGQLAGWEGPGKRR